MCEQEFRFTEHDFNLLRTLVSVHTGICLSEHKREMLYSRLSRRLRLLNLKSFFQYYKLLKMEGGEELVHFINAVTTNLTAFFREPHHFELLEKELLPQLLIKNKPRAVFVFGQQVALVVRKLIQLRWCLRKSYRTIGMSKF